MMIAMCGCFGSRNVKVLSNDEFTKRFSAPTAETATNAASSVTSTNAASGSSTNAVSADALAPRLIAPGMVLTVIVAEDANLNRQYMVPPAGVVEVLGVGRLKVTGLTTDELAKKIKEPLERDYLQKATIQVTLESSASPGGMPGGAMPAGPGGGASAGAGGGGGVVYVLGNIGRPGPLMLPRDEVFTLTKVIIAAGGIATFGNGAKVRVLRYDANGKKFETRVNVERIMKNGDFEKDIVIQNGDWIIVPEKWINF